MSFVRTAIFRKFSLKQKILLAYILLIIIPMPAIAVFNYTSSVRVLENKTQKQLGIASIAINEQFDNYFRDIDVISNDILKNEQVQKSLNRLPEDVREFSYKNVVEQRDIQNYFTGITAKKPGLSSIILYGYNQFNSYQSNSYSWDVNYDASSGPLYQEIVSASGNRVLTGIRQEDQLFRYGGSRNENVVTFGRVIKDLNTLKPLGVLMLDISVDYLGRIGAAAVNEGQVSVYDSRGQVIVNSRPDQIRDVLEIARESAFTGWKTIYYVPKQDLLKETRQIRNIIIVMTVLAIGMAVFMANLISSGIVKPVHRLRARMKEVAEGDFETRLEYELQDEMGDLIQRFNEMTDKVSVLIGEIQLKEKQRLRTEIDALQARINPHFMYNTLNSIRLLAMMDGNEKMTKLLTSFVYLLKFASKLKGNMISIRDELCILEAYSDLMKFRYENFVLHVRCDEETRRYMVIPFVMQPLVENSIFHGFAPVNRQGVIEVSVYVQDETVYADVRDNGIGMDKKVSDRLLAEDESDSTFSSMGVKNVYDRLMLHFGDKAGMTIDSEEGRGTRIRLYWPAMKGGTGDAESHDRG